MVAPIWLGFGLAAQPGGVDWPKRIALVVQAAHSSSATSESSTLGLPRADLAAGVARPPGRLSVSGLSAPFTQPSPPPVSNSERSRPPCTTRRYPPWRSLWLPSMAGFRRSHSSARSSSASVLAVLLHPPIDHFRRNAKGSHRQPKFIFPLNSFTSKNQPSESPSPTP
jgi:hypothetical protein